MKKLLLVLTLTVTLNWAHAQKYAELIRGMDTSTPFSEIQRIINHHFDTMRVRNKEYKQWKRYEWMASRRQGPGGILEDPGYHNREAIAQREQMRSQMGDQVEALHGSWGSLGPYGTDNANGNVGRVVCMAFHPTDANTYYVGTASGGLWKTTNGGTSYTPLTDFLPSVGISGIVVHPTNPNIIYILTGDGNGSHRSHYIRHFGSGVFKSTDGGTTWYETGLSWDLNSLTFGFKLMMHPSNSNVLLAATSTGFWRSLNGGVTWENTLHSVEISDIEFKPGSPSHIFASGYSNKFYFSTDTGRTWSNRNVPAVDVDRMEIGVSPASPNLIYFLCGPNSGTGAYKGIFTMNTASSYGSATITSRSTTPNIYGYDNAGNDDVSQTWRNISIYVSPTDAADIFTGGCFIWKSTDFGVTMTKSSGSIHADNHFILKSPFNNDLYSGCDGGLFKSTDGGTTWNSVSYGIASTQFYRFDASATTLFRILAGAQDNSQMLRNGSSTYNLMSCCDGMDNAVDYTNHDIMYMCTQGGDLSKSTNGVDNSAAITQPTSIGDYWVTNINIHTTTHTTLFFGGTGGIRRSVNSGSTWLDIGASGQDGMAQGISNDDRMYAASGLTLRRSDNVNATASSVTWTNVSGSGANYPSDASIFITAIAVNPDNSDEVWITCCGFVSGQKVYRSLDGGTSWSNMSAGLPNLPVHSIVFEDNNSAPGGAVYIGTELGVYYRNNSIGSWIPYGNGLPNAPVTDLKIYYGATRYIYASTYGRGMWYSTSYTGCTADVTLNATYQGYRFYEASNSIVSSGTMQGNLSTEMHLRSGNYIQFTPGADFSAADGQLRAWIGTCGSGGIPNMRHSGEVLQVKDPEDFFAVQPEPILMQVQSPVLQTDQGNRFVLAFHSDGVQETRVSLKDAKGETLGYFIRTVLPAGNYQLRIPELNTRAGLQIKWQMGEADWRKPLQR